MIVLPKVFSPEELRLLREFLEIAEFEAGTLTATGLAAARKRNLQLSRKQDSDGAQALDQVVLEALQRHELFRAYAWPKRVTSPIYARYEPGMEYGAHVDGSLMGAEPPLRTDVSVTLFLSEPSEYDGGELAIDLGGGAVQNVKLPAGSGFAYPTTAVHLVRPVTRGRRLVVVLWTQSYAPDPRAREALFDLRAIRDALNTRAAESLEAQLLQKTLSNLERMFAVI